ncbi:MAG: DUF4340 domain-containing protein [Clostridia bacterium]|nr:DUF4340 domain-containing protein [Clostridia bacterium]
MTNEHVNPDQTPALFSERPDFSKPPRRRRSSIKRQRLLLIIALAAVVVLAVAAALIVFFTSRSTFEDVDGAKYYILKRDGVWVMENTEHERLYQDADDNYITRVGTIVMVDAETGDFKVVSYVTVNDTETLDFNYNSGEYDILMYPRLRRYGEEELDEYRIASVEIHNPKGSFSFVLDSNNDYILKGYPSVEYNEVMLATLAYCTGTPRVMLRITPDVVERYTFAEYGLDDSSTYYVVTSGTGVAHKVFIGDKIPSGEGYYVRYEGRDSVYILYDLTETDYSSTFSATLVDCAIEDYVTPTVMVEMSATNYFDVSDFRLYRLEDYAGGAIEDYDPFISFYYEPIEKRRGTFYSSVPYFAEEDFDGYTINTYRADDCLMSLQELAAGKTVWLDSTEDPITVEKFRERYGQVSYYVTFNFNAERYGKEKNYAVKTEIEQRILISELSANDTYFMYNEMFDMVVEVSREYLEFIEWSRYEWIDNGIFSGNIGYLTQIEAIIPGGTTAGVTGVKKILLTYDNSASLSGENATDQNGNISSEFLKVYAQYGSMTSGTPIDVTQARRLYQSLFYSSLAGPTGLSEQEQEAYRATGDSGAMLVLRLTYDIGEDEPLVREYRFYDIAESARQCFVTLNGNGSFYMEQNRVDKLVRDLGRVLLTDAEALAANPIDPLATVERQN